MLQRHLGDFSESINPTEPSKYVSITPRYVTSKYRSESRAKAVSLLMARLKSNKLPFTNSGSKNGDELYFITHYCMPANELNVENDLKHE